MYIYTHIYASHAIKISKKEAVNFKESGKWYIGRFGWSKEKGKCCNAKIFLLKEIHKIMNGIKINQ